MTLNLLLLSGDNFLWGLKFVLLFLIAWTFVPTYIFPWNSTPFPPCPSLRLNHTIRARHLLQSALAQSSEGLGWCALWDAHLSFLDVLIIATVSHRLTRTLSSCQSLSCPFRFPPITAHDPFSFLLFTLAVWISDFLCTDDYNWGTVLRHSDVPDATQTLCRFIFLIGFIYSWGLTLPEINLFF